MLRVPWGLNFHWVPGVEEAKAKNAPGCPVRVVVPAMVWVAEAGKVKVSAVVTDLVRLLKVVEPAMVWEVPLRFTVPELWVKVPAVLVKLPATVRVPAGAKKVSSAPSVELKVRWWKVEARSEMV